MTDADPRFVPTCDLCDVHKADTSGAFRVLPPVFLDFGAVERFCGEVVTVKCFEDNSLVKAAVESPGEQRVLVVDGGGSLRRALLGGNLGATAVKNGWAGIVIDGCVRDVAHLDAVLWNLSDLTETSTSVILRTPRDHQPLLPPRALSEVPAAKAARERRKT